MSGEDVHQSDQDVKWATQEDYSDPSTSHRSAVKAYESYAGEAYGLDERTPCHDFGLNRHVQSLDGHQILATECSPLASAHPFVVVARFGDAEVNRDHHVTLKVILHGRNDYLS